MDNQVRLVTIDISHLPLNCQRNLDKQTANHSNNTGLTVQLALDYSGRWEIVQAARKLALDAQRGNFIRKISPNRCLPVYWKRSVPDPGC